jgi:hypothetical protein
MTKKIFHFLLVFIELALIFSLMNSPNEYNTSTPELAKLFKEMNEANAKLKKVRVSPMTRSPEYKAAMVAYRAYWDAVDKAEGRILV